MARMMATSDFSGLTSAACALASAVARAATVSLDRGIRHLRVQEVEAHSARLRAFSPHPMAYRLLRVLGQQGLEFAFGPLMFHKRFSCVAIERRELGPGIR